MTFYYDDYPISHGWLDPVTTLIGGLFLLGLLGLAGWFIRTTQALTGAGRLLVFRGTSADQQRDSTRTGVRTPQLLCPVRRAARAGRSSIRRIPFR
jgi:hypothetical protein